MSISLVTVVKRNGEDINSLLKRFKRKVENSNHIPELKSRRYYLKPSVVKRTKKNEVLFKLKKEKELELERIKRGKSRM